MTPPSAHRFKQHPLDTDLCLSLCVFVCVCACVAAVVERSGLSAGGFCALCVCRTDSRSSSLLFILHSG